jgi:hypothetical protein
LIERLNAAAYAADLLNIWITSGRDGSRSNVQQEVISLVLADHQIRARVVSAIPIHVMHLRTTRETLP